MFWAGKARVDALEIRARHLELSNERAWDAIKEILDLSKNITEKTSLLKELQSAESQRTNMLIAKLEERIARLEERTAPIDDREA